MFRIRIRMDPGFFADTDPDFKTRIRPFFAFNIFNNLMRSTSKWCSLISFWRILTEKRKVLSVIKHIFSCTYGFRPALIRFHIFRIRSGFFADPDPDSGKKFRSVTKWPESEILFWIRKMTREFCIFVGGMNVGSFWYRTGTGLKQFFYHYCISSLWPDLLYSPRSDF